MNGTDTICVSIIGFGYVGATLGHLLLNTHDTFLNVNIIDPDPERSGTITDIAHALALEHRHTITVNDAQQLAQADFVFHCAGHKNNAGESRLSVAAKNIELTYNIFEGLSFAKKPFVIVVTNPVDVICHHVCLATKLPPERIAGTGTLLDSARLAFYAARTLQCSTRDIQAWVLGEHGDSMTPIYSRCTYLKKPLADHPMMTRETLLELENQTRNAASEIRKTQEFTYYGPAQCAAYLFHAIRHNLQVNIPISACVDKWYSGRLSCCDNLFLGLPVQLGKSGWKILDNFGMEEDEWQRLKASACLLEKHLSL